MAGLGAQKNKDFLEHGFVFGLGGQGVARHLDECMRRVGNKLRGHLGGWQDVIHHSDGNGTARHAIKVSRLGGLRHYDTARLFDRPQAQRAVTTGS